MNELSLSLGTGRGIKGAREQPLISYRAKGPQRLEGWQIFIRLPLSTVHKPHGAEHHSCGTLGKPRHSKLKCGDTVGNWQGLDPPWEWDRDIGPITSEPSVYSPFLFCLIRETTTLTVNIKTHCGLKHHLRGPRPGPHMALGWAHL